jgi:hypothetical protein
MQERPPCLTCELGTESPVRDARLVLDVRRQDPLVPLRQRLGQPGRELGVARAGGGEIACAGPERAHGSHRDDRRGQALRDRLQHALVRGAGAVDLVHEDQRRNPQPLQGAHQDAGLRLDALHGRDDEHRPVQHAQHPLDLGDEVRVAGRVDQVDRDVVDRERDDGGLDRDAPLPFEREGVGLRRALVDAPDLVDDAGGVEQPLGERRLTGVYMRQDPQVERFPRQASYPPNRSQGPSCWT